MVETIRKDKTQGNQSNKVYLCLMPYALQSIFECYLTHREPLSACLAGGILWSPKLTPPYVYKGRWGGEIFLGPVPSVNRIPGDRDSRHLARSLAGTETLEARFSSLQMWATLSGSQGTIGIPEPQASVTA